MNGLARLHPAGTAPAWRHPFEPAGAGQVENQVGLVRERFFTPRLRVKSLDELNAWLIDECVAYAKAHRHPEQSDKTVWEMFEAERPKLVPYAGHFDGFHSVPAARPLSSDQWRTWSCSRRPARSGSTSDEDQKTIRGIVFLRNKCSVLTTAVGRPVEVHAYAERIMIRQNGVIVGEHVRAFGRGEVVYDPWHYVPVLARKPGALRSEPANAIGPRERTNAPFRNWLLPPALAAVRRKLTGADDGDRQMVQILSCVADDGLPAVEAACREALDNGVHSAPVVINILARRREPAPPPFLLTPAALRLTHEPVADCARLMTASGGHPSMERTQVLDLMSTLKLYGMRSAYDEVMANGIKRQHEPPRIVGDLARNPRLPKSRPGPSATNSR